MAADVGTRDGKPPGAGGISPGRGRRARPPGRAVHAVLALAVALGVLAGAAAPGLAEAERRPYDEKLLRLAEILGAVHYLRSLCNSGEGQGWRERMTALLEAEGSSAARRALLTQSFNRGFRTYSRSYRTCTATAETANKRFIAEAAEITAGLLKQAP